MTNNNPTDPRWIDRAALRRLLAVVGNDPDELGELIDDYIEDAPDLACRMADAAANGDRDAFRIAAHTLKSNARDFGAIRLSELCSAAEAASASLAFSTDLTTFIDDIASAERAAREVLLSVNLENLGDIKDTE